MTVGRLYNVNENTREGINSEGKSVERDAEGKKGSLEGNGQSVQSNKDRQEH